MTYAEFCAQKLAQWKERNPGHAERLRVAVSRRLGMPRGPTSEIATRLVEGWECEVLTALLGWPDQSQYHQTQEAMTP